MNTENTKWTPGPWHIAQYGSSDPSYTIVRGDLAVANIAGPRRNGDDYKRVPRQEQSDANARLIALAPEMAEALAAFIAFMSKGYQSDDELELIDRARAILARINGGSE